MLTNEGETGLRRTRTLVNPQPDLIQVAPAKVVAPTVSVTKAATPVSVAPTTLSVPIKGTGAYKAAALPTAKPSTVAPVIEKTSVPVGSNTVKANSPPVLTGAKASVIASTSKPAVPYQVGRRLKPEEGFHLIATNAGAKEVSTMKATGIGSQIAAIYMFWGILVMSIVRLNFGGIVSGWKAAFNSYGILGKIMFVIGIIAIPLLIMKIIRIVRRR